MMQDKTGFLNTAYALENVDETRAFYDKWATTYDQEIADNGYETPRRCAAALVASVPDLNAPILDLGCGTGLSGLALRQAGFTSIDGCDLSQGMLDQAAKRNGIYRALWLADVSDPFPFQAGTYAHIVAIGVIATTHAPARTIDAALNALPSGGCFVFSLNDHTLQDPSFEARVLENVDTGNAVVLFREYGDHLPGLNMRSNVYVLQKV
jgi:predicted TPR repeat methyltransferase